MNVYIISVTRKCCFVSVRKETIKWYKIIKSEDRKILIRGNILVSVLGKRNKNLTSVQEEYFVIISITSLQVVGGTKQKFNGGENHDV